MAQTNTVLTQIAVKRLSGKAQSNANSSLAQEPKGSTVQTSATTVFGEALPNNPAQTLYLIQSESISSPGTVMFAEFEIRAFGDQYANDGEDGETTVNTYHAYELILSTSFDDGISEADFNTHASTPTVFGAFPFDGGSHMTGSRGRLQIVPEYVSDIPAGVGASNLYTPKLYNTLATPTEISATDSIDWYIDVYSGILFIQDPVAYGTIGSPDAGSAIPGKLTAFAYVGKYQDQMSYGISDISLHISASEGTAFDLVNTNTASFESGSAGITVTADASKKITIGASTDNVTFASLTGSNLLITNTASITYFETTYESSSIIYSSGSTKFGDTNDDTHIFTGSVSILYTGSGPVGPEYGFQMSGSNFLIDYGNSGSVTLGTHNVGKELIGIIYPITGSGLIISQSFTNEATHHNMVKIGETELVDISGSNSSDSFLINVREKALIISSSLLDKPVVEIEAGNHVFYGSTSGKTIFKIDGDQTTLGSEDSTATTVVKGSSIFVLPSTATLNMGVGSDSAGEHSGTYNSSNALMIGLDYDLLTGGTSGTVIQGAKVDNIYPLLYGAITASSVSSSGDLFASLSLESTAGADVLAVVYDTGSGQFFFTGSYGATDTTNLEASASAGIFLSASEGTGFSIGLMQSASFTSGSGGGLTVTAGATNNIEFTLVGVLSSSQQIATDISGAIDAATGSLLTNYGLLSGSAQIATEISGAIGAATASLSASIVGTANEVEVVGTLGGTIQIGLPDDVTITGDLAVNGDTLATDDATFNLLDTTATTINFGGAATTIDIGAAGASNVNIKGSASIDGDLIVRGTTTSINTQNLNVEDPFILLNSGSNSGDGGIIIQTAAGGVGTALFFDDSISRWGLTKKDDTAWNATTATPRQFIVSVSSSAGTPTSTPSDFGGNDASRYGMMYVDSSNADGDGNTIWIYAE